MPVELIISGRHIAAEPDSSLFEHAQRAGITIPSSCGQQGRCRECIVEVTAGMALLSGRDRHEQHLQGGYRLACRSRIAAAQGVVRCQTLRRGRLQIERHAPALAPRGRAALDPAVTRDGDRILLDGREIARSRAGIHGLAVDLGTTTVVLRLLDLETGEQVAEAAFENPQRFGGSDVMSRIRYDTEHPGKHLRRTLARYLARSIRALPLDPCTIYEVVVVGNPTMRDIFFRQDVHSIGQSPYRSQSELALAAGRRTSTSLALGGRRSLLPVHPRARVYGAPIISGHVGADAAAAMLAVDLAAESDLVALMDIGTNTELIVGNRERVLAASCPAGPAFEGGRIACGMPALEGAIDSVSLAADGSWRLRTIGGAEPLGICGSGLVELLSELRQRGRMSELGRFAPGERRVYLDRAREIFISESDVTELAQAKAATAAGLQVVFGAYDANFDEVSAFYLAGAFGRNLDVDAAIRIGLLPPLPRERFRQVGNAAIEGATSALLSRTRRAELERTVRQVEHCRLETHPRFFDCFVEGCRFRPLSMGAGPQC